MKLGKGIIFILTEEDIVTMVREIGASEDIIDDRFLEEIKDGIGDLVVIEIKRFIREITSKSR